MLCFVFLLSISRLLDLRGPVLRHVGGVRRDVFNRFHPEPVRHLAGPVHPHQGSAQVSRGIHSRSIAMKPKKKYEEDFITIINLRPLSEQYGKPCRQHVEFATWWNGGSGKEKVDGAWNAKYGRLHPTGTCSEVLTGNVNDAIWLTGFFHIFCFTRKHTFRLTLSWVKGTKNKTGKR